MNKLNPMPGRILVGLSGGADSVALLLLLLEGGTQVCAVHVNHGLRGESSDGDEAFVRELCERHHVRLYVYRADPPEDPGENWARQVRYGFFRQAMEASRAEALVLAHHRDDQAETLLLHLMRGAGLNGLTGMAADSRKDGIRILRPLLTYSRQELRAYLQEKGQTWREDASNADARYLRNAVRHELMPLMERLAPGASRRIATACSLLSEDEAALEGLTAAFLAAHPGLALPLDALQDQPAGLQKRILRSWWTDAANPQEERSLSAQQTDALHGLIDAPASSQCNLPCGWHAQRGWTHIHLMPPVKAQPMQEMPAEECPLLRVEEFTGSPGDGKTCQAIPRVWLKDCVVRSRRPGDDIRPFGAVGKQSLQDYLVNRRVDAAFRDQVPLLCRGSEVLLVGGVGAGHIPRINEYNDPILLRWTENFPWQQKQQKDGGKTR